MPRDKQDAMTEKKRGFDNEGFVLKIEERAVSQMDAAVAGVTLGLLTRWALRRTRRLTNPGNTSPDNIVTIDFSIGCVDEEGDK